MATLQRPPIPQAPLVDPQTGYVTREWWRWFASIGVVVGEQAGEITTVKAELPGLVATGQASPMLEDANDVGGIVRQSLELQLLQDPLTLSLEAFDQSTRKALELAVPADQVSVDQVAALAAMLQLPADPLRAGNGLSLSGTTISLTTPVSAANGGTGVSNAVTLTLSGNNFTFNGPTLPRTYTFPDATEIVATLGQVQTFTGAKSFNSGTHILKGATSGTLTVNAAAVAGSNTLTLPAGTTDFSATGGANQVVQQTSAGGALTVGQLAASNLSDGNTGTGAIVHQTAGTLTDSINQGYTACTSSLTKTSDTTPADIPGLSVTLTAGATYVVRAHLAITSGAAGGFKVLLTGTATITSDSFTAFMWNGTTIVSNATVNDTLPITVSATAKITDMWIDGAIVVNAGGTLKLQGAQNVSDLTPTVYLRNSSLSCVRVS